MSNNGNIYPYLLYLTVLKLETYYIPGADTWKWQQNNPNGYKL